MAFKVTGRNLPPAHRGRVGEGVPRRPWRFLASSNQSLTRCAPQQPAAGISIHGLWFSHLSRFGRKGIATKKHKSHKKGSSFVTFVPFCGYFFLATAALYNSAACR